MTARFWLHPAARCVGWALVVLTALATSLAAQPLEAGASRHFVLLIDDSGDMRSSAAAVARLLPPLLLGDGEEGGERQAAWRPFDPARDLLTTFFFAVHRDGPADTCKPDRRFSMQSIFAQAEISATNFASDLRRELGRPCRWGGYYSPILTATSLALPTAAREVAGRRVDSTLLLVVTNDFFNTTVSPAFELRHIQSHAEGELRGVEAAEAAVEDVMRKFRLGLPQGWSREADTGGGPLSMRVFRVEAMAASPDSLVGVPSRINLDRWAVSSEEVRWRVPAGARPIRLRSTAELRPVTLSWRIIDPGGEPWVLGQRPVGSEPRHLDLSECSGPCVEVEGGMEVAVGPLVGLPAMAADEPVPTGEARMEVSVLYRYESGGVYDSLHSVVRRSMALELAAVRELEAFLFTDAQPLDNAVLSGLWTEMDGGSGGVSQEIAVERLVASYSRDYLVRGGALLGVAVLGVGLLFRTSYHRPFVPELEWHEAGAVRVEPATPGGPRLAGTVEVRNLGRQPWLGRLLGHADQPGSDVELSVASEPFAALGFHVEAGDGAACLGFLASEEAGSEATVEALRPAIRRPVSHGQRIPVFVATDVATDFAGQADHEGLGRAELDARLTMSPLDDGARWSSPLEVAASVDLQVVPEPAAAPGVEFVPTMDEVEFRLGGEEPVGVFRFHSGASRCFARPFVGEYTVEVFCAGAPLPPGCFRLGTPEVTLAGRESADVPLWLRFDGVEVTNPEAGSRCYEVFLRGPMGAGSARGPHSVVLRRDSRRAEAEVRLRYLSDDWEIYRTQAGSGELRGPGGRTWPLAGAPVELPVPFPFRIPADGGAGLEPTLWALSLGNSGRSGRGRVEVVAEWSVEVSENAAPRLHWRDGHSAQDLVVLHGAEGAVGQGDGERGLTAEIAEGEPPVEWTFRLQGESVRSIDGARLEGEDVRVTLSLAVRVVDDAGEESRWQAGVAVRVPLEQVPGLNWLCVDFGTSAIAAAAGRADGDAFRRIDLQGQEVVDGHSLASVDERNVEAGTPFLPSWVACDGDLRRDFEDKVGFPAGFPLHRNESPDLWRASFVGLPATSNALNERPGRVVMSLKQQLARLAGSVHLDPEVRYTLDGVERVASRVPLDALLEATLAALFETYLSTVPDLAVDQVVLTHPNSYSPRHRERFRRIAGRVLLKRRVVASLEHVALLSESDAVAYAYCVDKLNGERWVNPQPHQERVLVYDFGAGTLDLSLVLVEWRRDRWQPRSWTVEARMGLPLAGNHLDEILARMVDDRLRRPEVVPSEAGEYAYPLVGKRPRAGDAEEHRRSVLATWRQVREGKHRWDGVGPLEVVVGAEGSGVVRRSGEKGRLPEGPPGAGSGLYDDGEALRLSLAAEEVRGDPRLRDFLDLVGDQVIGELLVQAGCDAAEVDTVLVSGRGALFPGIQERLQARLPGVHSVDPGDDARRKDVVARGAIAFQALRHRLSFRHAETARPSLGLILGRSLLVEEREWAGGQPVDLEGFEEFRVVQIGLGQPDRVHDLEGLRRHFYIDLTPAPIRTRTLWSDDPRLFVTVEESGEDLRVTLGNAAGQSLDLDTDLGGRAPSLRLPWPMGGFLLAPEEEES